MKLDWAFLIIKDLMYNLNLYSGIRASQCSRNPSFIGIKRGVTHAVVLRYYEHADSCLPGKGSVH